jgi:hypothetical protein
MSSLNCESSISEWKYEVGACEALEACDSLLISRYILHRLAEDFELTVKFELNNTILIPSSTLLPSPQPSFLHNLSSVFISTREINAANSPE